jgi:hypothetical protein
MNPFTTRSSIIPQQQQLIMRGESEQQHFHMILQIFLSFTEPLLFYYGRSLTRVSVLVKSSNNKELMISIFTKLFLAMSHRRSYKFNFGSGAPLSRT